MQIAEKHLPELFFPWPCTGANASLLQVGLIAHCRATGFPALANFPRRGQTFPMPHVVPFIHLSHELRRQLFHTSVLVVAGPDAVRAENCTPQTSSTSPNRIPASAVPGGDVAEKFDAVGDPQLAETPSSSRIIHPHVGRTTLRTAEGGYFSARLQSFCGLACPHSTRQRHDCTPRCPARCPYCPLRPHLQPLSLSCGSIDALSAGVAHSTRRACTLLLNYKLAQRYSLALATPVRRHVTLAARSAARRR